MAANNTEAANTLDIDMSLEVNPLLSALADMHTRTDVLRGYL